MMDFLSSAGRQPLLSRVALGWGVLGWGVLCAFAMLACEAAGDVGETPHAKSADPFADRVVSFTPGPSAGFGADKLPGVVLGPPQGGGGAAGSLDVVSLGQGGTLVVALDDQPLIDGPGADLLVFENAFAGFIETGRVAVSADGKTWHEWPCAAQQAPDYPGCAGVTPVFSAAGNGISPTSAALAGGDAFDLQALGAIGPGPWRLVRISDTGVNQYLGTSGGFDLDAVAVIHHP